VTDTAPGAPIRPLLRQRVHLRLARWGASVPSVVEDVLDTDLIVAGPLGLAAGQEPSQGERLTIWWEDPNGPRQLPCEMGNLLMRELPSWQVRPVGEARSDQRRRHVRVVTDGPVTIIRDRQAHAATLLDLSEGGLRAELSDAGTVIGVGDQISVVLVLDRVEHDLRARVVRVHVVPGQPRTIAATFLDLAIHHADELRRHVFAEQTRVRARTIQ
jgi:c-di-GMP-binding flagellar brake protein YcgR